MLVVLFDQKDVVVEMMVWFLKVKQVDLCTRVELEGTFLHLKTVLENVVDELVGVLEKLDANIRQDQIQELLRQGRDRFQVISSPRLFCKLILTSCPHPYLHRHNRGNQMLGIWLLDKLAGQQPNMYFLLHLWSTCLIIQHSRCRLSLVDLYGPWHHQACFR